MGKKGFTKFELAAAIIITAVVIAVAIPLVMHFIETQAQSMDRQRADRAEEVATTEYALSHLYSDGPVMYMFTGDTELLGVLRHAPYDAKSYDEISFPRTDKYDDGGGKNSGLAIEPSSKKLDGEDLIIVVGDSGAVLYNSWKQKLAAAY